MQTTTLPSHTAPLLNIDHLAYMAGGETYWLREPSTARDVLEVEVHIAAHLLRGGQVSAMYLARLVRWVARHVVDGPVPASEMAEHLDESFGVEGLLHMKNAIVALGGLPEEVLDGVREFNHILYSGGCECPVCVGGPRYEDAGEVSRRKMEEMCKYRGIPKVTVNIINFSHGLEATDPLTAPWWVYQLEAAKRVGRNRAYLEKERSEKTFSSVDKILKVHGR